MQGAGQLNFLEPTGYKLKRVSNQVTLCTQIGHKLSMASGHVIVTRHQALVALLKERGLIGENANVIERATLACFVSYRFSLPVSPRRHSGCCSLICAM